MIIALAEVARSSRTAVQPLRAHGSAITGPYKSRNIRLTDGLEPGTLKIHQIEEKVVNRLRQVTSAIRQAGSNQVSVITSSAEREAAIEFAKAAAIRPATLGQAFQEIAREPEVATALFDVLETQRILASSAKIAMLPGGPHGRMLANLMAAEKQG